MDFSSKICHIKSTSCDVTMGQNLI